MTTLHIATAHPAGTAKPDANAAQHATPVDHFLERQQSLSAVERFSKAHENGHLSAEAKHYSRLLPASPPEKGQQYAFEVDLDGCSGCKSCVAACHSLNGLDETETWRDVGFLVGGNIEEPVIQHVTSACHHCIDPACLHGCPVNAYEKDEATGIVRHFDDQCIGCQYCTLSCPYGVPKYHKQKGIVRKCDMCADRLAEGEAPACVQACPNEAIRITVVDSESIIRDSETNLFLPGAHDPQDTLPTTQYRSKRPLPRNMVPADYYSVKPEHAHWALVWMLVLSQLSSGAFFVEWLLGHADAARPFQAAAAMLFGITALLVAPLHLGRPKYAFRALIGLRKSWLSREILAFGIFAPLAILYAGLLWEAGPLAAFSHQAESVGTAAIVFGLVGVFCSMMIYAATRRAFWNPAFTSFRFFGTALLLGFAASLGVALVASAFVSDFTAAEIVAKQGGLFCKCLMVVTLIKLGFEAMQLGALRDRQNSPMKRTARLMTGPLASATMARFAAGVLGGIVLPALVMVQDWSVLAPALAAILGGVLFIACIAGEVLERYLFFSAVVAPRMPGGMAA